MMTSRDALSMLASLAVATLLSATPLRAQTFEPAMHAPETVMDVDMGCMADPCATDACEVDNYLEEGLGKVFYTEFPEWYFKGQALWLERNTEDRADRTLAVIGGAGGPVSVLTIGGLDFDYEPGMKLTIGRALDCTFGVEASFTTLHDWTVTNATPTGSFLSRGSRGFTLIAGGTIIPGFQSLTSQSVVYDNDFQNFELNFRARVSLFPHVEIIIGPRFISLDESLTIVESGTGVFGLGQVDTNGDGTPDTGGIGYTQSTQTDNILVGGHIGVDLNVPITDRIVLGTTGRFGGFSNSADVTVSQVATGPALQPIARTSFREASETAFLFESTLYAEYYVKPNISIKGGYHALSLTSIAVAPRQFVPVTGGGGFDQFIDLDGRPSFTGFFFELEVKWGLCD